MARFKITTPVPDFTGESAGVLFHSGCAEVDTATDFGVSALSYFRSAGYGIEPLSNVSAEDALRTATVTPEAEAAELRAEIAKLADASEIDDLRRERDRMREAAEKARAERERPRLEDRISVGNDDGPEADLLAAPPDSDRVADWRAYAVANLGLTDAQVKTMNTGELRAAYERRAVEVDMVKGGAK